MRRLGRDSRVFRWRQQNDELRNRWGSNEESQKSAPIAYCLALALVGLISTMAVPGYSRNQPAMTGREKTMQGLGILDSRSHFIRQSGKTIDVPHSGRNLYS